jgi:hypothetical protein
VQDLPPLACRPSECSRRNSTTNNNSTTTNNNNSNSPQERGCLSKNHAHPRTLLDNPKATVV